MEGYLIDYFFPHFHDGGMNMYESSTAAALVQEMEIIYSMKIFM